MRDPYDVLGVGRNASEAEIKKAYRRLAKAHHPDQNQGDTKAAAKFAEASQAYEILGDKEKRAKFDRGEIDAEGKPRFAGFEGFGGDPRTRTHAGGFEFEFGTSGRGRGRGRASAGNFDPSDLFSDLFGAMGGGPQRGRTEARGEKGPDASATVVVSFTDAAKGAKTRVHLPTGKDLDVTIPPGTSSGKVMRLRAQGFPAPFGGEPGDVLLTVKVEPHPLFASDGKDLRLELPVSLDEAVLGAKVRVPTLDGFVDLTIPPGSDTGRTLRLRGKGVPAPDGAGDLYVTLKVNLPANDPDLKRLAETIRQSRPYRVRGREFDG